MSCSFFNGQKILVIEIVHAISKTPDRLVSSPIVMFIVCLQSFVLGAGDGCCVSRHAAINYVIRNVLVNYINYSLAHGGQSRQAFSNFCSFVSNPHSTFLDTPASVRLRNNIPTGLLHIHTKWLALYNYASAQARIWKKQAGMLYTTIQPMPNFRFFHISKY